MSFRCSTANTRTHGNRSGDSASAAILAVPLMREDRAIGAIVALAQRSARVSPKSRSRWCKTFADQAAIAIENVRLFNETKEALEQQTAIARDPARHLELADRRAAGARRDCRARGAPVRRSVGVDVPDRRRHAAASRVEGTVAGAGDTTSTRCRSTATRSSGRAMLERKTIQRAGHARRGGSSTRSARDRAGAWATARSS